MRLYAWIAAYAFRRYSTDGPRQWLAIPPAGNAAAVVAAVAARHEVEDISLREPGIEDLITRLYGIGVPAEH
jgi:ABC-2 type transport system ATP-binding protein